MSRGVARLGDKTFGTCSHPSHRPLSIGGKIITASGNTNCNNKPVARLGDTVLTDCGHTSIIITASPNGESNTNGGTARLGDLIGAGPYSARIITASGDTFINAPGSVPPVIIPAEIQAAINRKTERFVSNPSAFSVESEDQVKRHYPGTPEQPADVGESLIDPTAATAGDIVPFLSQVLSEADQGKWEETGMGGRPSNPNITGIWTQLGYPKSGAWTTDQTAWCMGFVNWVLQKTGYRYVQTARARDIRDRAGDYKAQQIPLTQGQPGDIALWSYSHVNFIYSANGGRYTFVGGNQSTKARNNNNPSQGSITRSWVSGYKPPGDNTLVGIWRPVRA
jgi:uncharacterized Zn-binding protein involved in type VI secretion